MTSLLVPRTRGEMKPGKGAQLARSAGAYAQMLARETLSPYVYALVSA